MASDDPVQLPTIQWTTPEDVQTEITSHLSTIRSQRHLRNLTAPVNKKRTDDIYQERITTQQDTVTQDWFHSDGGGIYQHQWDNHSSNRTTSKDLLTSTSNSVRFGIRRAGTKASHTLRKLTLKQTPSIQLPLEPSQTQTEPTRQGGRPLAPARTNSSFESTIPLPQSFDLARYRSTSSQSTLSTVDWIPLQHPSSSNRLSRSSPQTIPIDLNDIEPEPRVPTPPPFPSSHSHSQPQSRATSPLLTSPSPFLPLSPLTEHSPTAAAPSRTLSSSPTSSLHNYSPPLAPPTAHRRTLTIDDYSSPPSRRDTITSFLLPRNGNSLVSHLKNSLHLHQTSTSHHSTTSSLGGGGGSPSLSRSPTSIHQSHARRRKHAKEELQKLFLRRKKLISKVERGEEGEEKEKEFDRAIVERLKELGALIDEREKIEMDVLWEHQRGLIVFGLPKFSSAALFQFDPSVWTNEQLKPSPYTPHDFPCRPYWNWRDREFMVDMGGDRDEEGWSYAVFFHSKRWRGEPSLLRSFVRRRKWIRTRIYTPLPTLLEKSLDPSAIPLDSAHSQFHSIDGAIYSDDHEEEEEVRGQGERAEVRDLKSACYCLPLTREEKRQLFESLSLPSNLVGKEHQIPPLNPFIPFRAILAHSQQAQSGSGGGGHKEEGRNELVWRSGLREINERRVKEVMKRVARIDRERLALWRVWLDAPKESGREGGGIKEEEGWEGCSEWNEWRVGEMEGWTEWLEDHRREGSWEIKEEENEQENGVEEEDFADKDKRTSRASAEGDGKSGKSGKSASRSQRVEKPDLEDVWDLIEARLDNVLQLFDFHLTRLAFLRLLISCHPLASTPIPSSPSKKPPFKHQHEGYDLPFEERRRRKELEWEKRLKWVTGVKEEVRRMEGGGGPPVEGRVEEVKKGGRGGGGRERTRSERRERKGKQRAIHQDY